ncbi:MAG: MBL fold metallo-hydrolase [Deltaproteobacteria bacterium]|nr:MBL fold metallo-hydrolase [Deltaproteobacteria bacterium]
MRTTLAAALALSLSSLACAATSHGVRPSTLGTSSSSDALEAVIDQPGPVTLETIKVCDWVVDRSGLINLDHPKAKEAKLTDGDEPIQVYFYALHHPTQGLFIVDSGFEKKLRDDPSNSAFGWMVRKFADPAKMKWGTPLGDWLPQQREPLKGIFLTHLHLDHVGGVPDPPAGTLVYTGPGDSADSKFSNLFVQGSTNRSLDGKDLIEWQFKPDAGKRFQGVLDVFGDGSVWALWTPGHTPGSVAFLVRTPKGPVLLTGDTSHTRWGWEHHVEPGSFTSDQAQNAVSLEALEKLVAAHPKIEVHLGHQE